MTISQQIFMLFFAIFWGASANAQPRWKAFDWGNFCDQVSRQRALLSFLLLNLGPGGYFLVSVWILGHFPRNSAEAIGVRDLLLILPGIIAALGVFGFYRFWMGVVQVYSEQFYGDISHRREFNISLNDSDLERRKGVGNIIAGLAWTGVMFFLAFSPFIIATAFSS